MNTLFTRVAAVAGLVLSAAAGQAAQKFDVKFNFRTPAGEHAAGKYVVDARNTTAGAGMIYLRNQDTGKAVVFYPLAPVQKLNADGPARLAFKCSDKNGCNLAEVWSNANFGYTVRQRKITSAEAERMTAVVVPASTNASE